MRAGDESGPVSVDGLSHSIVGSDDGFERYVLQRNPRPKNSNGLRMQLVKKSTVFNLLIIKDMVEAAGVELFTMLTARKLSYERGCQEKNSPPPPRGDVDVVICIQPLLPS
jgi:hypothetical protein